MADSASPLGILMRVRFTRNFSYRPPERRGRTIAFKAGMEKTVKRHCGNAAVAAGRAIEVPVPNRFERAARR